MMEHGKNQHSSNSLVFARSLIRFQKSIRWQYLFQMKILENFSNKSKKRSSNAIFSWRSGIDLGGTKLQNYRFTGLVILADPFQPSPPDSEDIRWRINGFCFGTGLTRFVVGEENENEGCDQDCEKHSDGTWRKARKSHGSAFDVDSVINMVKMTFAE